MDYLIRFAQKNETFRQPELEALAVLANVNLEIVHYSVTSPFCVVRLESEKAARALIARSILAQSIYELWGAGKDDNELITNVRNNSTINAGQYHESFRFDFDSFKVKRTMAEQRQLIDQFRFLPFKGQVKMKDPELQICIFEECEKQPNSPNMVYLGRRIATSDRDSIHKYDLKKRHYISRTSMEAELSLVTANMLLAAPGKVVFDPFVGTGSFTVACAHFGALTLGGDIDGRSIRGTPGRDLLSNFHQYGLANNLFDSIISDLTNTPIRAVRFLDGIVCDPPYGIREGPKVLGYREGKEAVLVMIDGVPAHLRHGYIAPKRPYSFDDMMMDVLDFSYLMLVDNARLCMWMPTANDDDVELAIPTHPGLKLISVSVQPFNKWARRLLTYRRVPDSELEVDSTSLKREKAVGVTADELNKFRKKYFDAFRPAEADDQT